MFLTSDSKNVIGFTKVQIPIPKIPVSITEPDAPGWIINRKNLLQKIARMRLSTNAHIGLKGTFSSDKFQMETVADRNSKESIDCQLSKKVMESSFLPNAKCLKMLLVSLGGM